MARNVSNVGGENEQKTVTSAAFFALGLSLTLQLSLEAAPGHPIRNLTAHLSRLGKVSALLPHR